MTARSHTRTRRKDLRRRRQRSAERRERLGVGSHHDQPTDDWTAKARLVTENEEDE